MSMASADNTPGVAVPVASHASIDTAGLAEKISEKNYLDRILQTIAEMVADKLDSPVCSIMLVDEATIEAP